MNELKINHLAIEGLKGNVDRVEFDLTGKTIISGDNGKGKTTIGEAICWALTGTGLWCEKEVSRLFNKDAEATCVEIDFTYDGKEHHLRRSCKGKNTVIKLDGKNAKNTDLEKFTNDKKVFLSIFNPAYFAKLTKKDAQDLIDKVTEDIHNDDVFSKMGEYTAKILRDSGFKYADEYLSEKRAELKDVEDDLIYSEGVIAGKECDIKIPKAEVFDDTRLKEAKKELAEVRSKEIVLPHDLGKLRLEKAELEKKIIEVKNAPCETISTSKIENQIHDLERQKYLIPKEPELENVYTLEANKDRLTSEWKSLTRELKALDNKIKCPNCQTEIDLDKSRKEEIEAELKEVSEQGKAVSKEIEKAIKHNDKLTQKHEAEVKKYLSDIDAKIKTLTEEKETLDQENGRIAKEHADRIDKEVVELQKQIDAMDIDKRQKENDEIRFKEAEFNRKCAWSLEAEIEELEKEKEGTERFNYYREENIKRKEGAEAEVKKMQEHIEKRKAYQAELKSQIDAAKEFNSIKLKIQTDSINQYLDKVSIRLKKYVQATGELKDDFTIMYDKKEFNVLSNSEEKKTGLEISNLFMNALDVKLPIFLDDAESITSYKAPCTQIIEARVMKGQELTVKGA